MSQLALLYLDTLDLVEFTDKGSYDIARQVANHQLRPYLTLGKRDRHGRLIWNTRDLHYFDPPKKTCFTTAYSRS